MVLDLLTYLTRIFESFGSVCTIGVPELFAMKKKWSGITFRLNHDLPFETEAAFPQAFPMNCPTWYRVLFHPLWFPVQIIAY
jgi:hypothetical protein